MVMLVREGAVIPQMQAALEMVAFSRWPCACIPRKPGKVRLTGGSACPTLVSKVGQALPPNAT
jgi:hypothetical protein